MTFDNTKDIENYLIQKLKTVIEVERERVFSIIVKFVQQYYSEYEPKYYERTYQLLRSCIKGDIVKTSNGYRTEIYFDTEHMDYSIKYFRDSRWKVEGGYINPFSYTNVVSSDGSFENNGDVEKVMESAMHGSHGGYIEGTAIWDESIELLNQNFRREMKECLRKNGIPVR